MTGARPRHGAGGSPAREQAADHRRRHGPQVQPAPLPRPLPVLRPELCAPTPPPEHDRLPATFSPRLKKEIFLPRRLLPVPQRGRGLRHVPLRMVVRPVRVLGGQRLPVARKRLHARLRLVRGRTAVSPPHEFSFLTTEDCRSAGACAGTSGRSTAACSRGPSAASRPRSTNSTGRAAIRWRNARRSSTIASSSGRSSCTPTSPGGAS